MISVCIFLCDHRLDHPSADRIESVDLRIRVPHRFLFALMKINPFFGETSLPVFKCQDRIDRAEYSLVSDRLLLLRDTRNLKIQLHIRSVYFLNISAVGYHRRYDRSHILRAVGIIFSIRSFTLGQHVVIIFGISFSRTSFLYSFVTRAAPSAVSLTS